MRESKAGVLAYPNSNNLGDFIQSIAAAQWFEGPPMFLDREALHLYQGQKVKLFMNGWFMEAPKNWPPSEAIRPLFISFHLNPTAEKGLLKPEGISYLKKHQPIGCRDLYTQTILERHGIRAYFSGCLTLSLKRVLFVNPNQKRKGILVVSPLERLLPTHTNTKKEGIKEALLSKIQSVKQPFKAKQYKQAMHLLQTYLAQAEDEIHYTSQLMDPKGYSEQERSKAALDLLKSIASAKMVVTSRIHTALPAVAFNTPVLFLADGLDHINQKSRLDGIDSFFYSLQSKDLKNKPFEIPKQKPVSSEILARFEKEITDFLNT
ncbi:MAG: polysaccharide pyruvyl transferase family protein [Flavobacteriaceae bacterium]|jgi:hypothetical protein